MLIADRIGGNLRLHRSCRKTLYANLRDCPEKGKAAPQREYR
jgi:hypothetical protein